MTTMPFLSQSPGARTRLAVGIVCHTVDNTLTSCVCVECRADSHTPLIAVFSEFEIVWQEHCLTACILPFIIQMLGNHSVFGHDGMVNSSAGAMMPSFPAGMQPTTVAVTTQHAAAPMHSMVPRHPMAAPQAAAGGPLMSQGRITDRSCLLGV